MGKQINELPSSPFTSGINIASQRSAGGVGSTISIKSDDILSLIESSTDLRFAATWDQPSFPTSPEDGQFWIISSAGEITIGGVNYYPNDWLVYINSTIGWKKNPVNLQFLQSQIDQKLGINNNLSDLQSVLIAKTNLSLNNVNNTSDLNKPISTATQTALDTKLSKTANLSDLSNIQTAKENLLLNNVDNTSDLNKPISTATQTALDTKLNKTSNLSDLQSITTAKTNLDLNNVDNTSDLNKPISTATQTALNSLSLSVTDKLSKSDNLSDLQSIPQAKSNLSINNVDNTSDLNKPISTATQTALTSLSNQITQVSGSDNYRGDHDLSSGSYPSATPSKGDYWTITVAGTISGGNLNGVSFNVADWILYLGATKQWIKVLNSVQSFSQVNSDWNSTSGISQILNKPEDTENSIPNTLVKRNSTSGFSASNVNLNSLIISSDDEVIDQDTIGGAVSNPSFGSFWQSITCSNSGYLTKVYVYTNFAANNEYTLTIKAGGNNTGAILTSFSQTETSASNPFIFILPTPITISSGLQYTFEVSFSGVMAVLSSSSSVYSGGLSNYPNKDIRFVDYVQNLILSSNSNSNTLSDITVLNNSTLKGQLNLDGQLISQSDALFKNKIVLQNISNNPYIAIGDATDTSNYLFGVASANGAYFSNTSVNDGVIRYSSSSTKIHIGIGSSLSNVSFYDDKTIFNKKTYFSNDAVSLITSNTGSLNFESGYYKINNTASGSYTLPDTSNAQNGSKITVKLISNFPITITPFSGNIDFENSITMVEYLSSLTFVVDETGNWLIT